MNRLDWYRKGVPFQEYVKNMKINREELLFIYQNAAFPDDVAARFEKLRNRIDRTVVLTADWCTDAMLCVPIMQRIAEITGMEQRFLIRDENLELMDQYLTGGKSRSIPIFIFLDKEGNEQAVWGPRSAETETAITKLRSNLPHQDSPDFAQKQKEMYAAYRENLIHDRTLWESIIKDIARKLDTNPIGFYC